MDAHVPAAVTRGLQFRSVDAVTAQEDGSDELSDPELLDRAGALGRVLFTHDDDHLVEAVRRQRSSEAFNGVIDIHHLELVIGRCIESLEMICKVCDPQDMANRIESSA